MWGSPPSLPGQHFHFILAIARVISLLHFFLHSRFLNLLSLTALHTLSLISAIWPLPIIAFKPALVFHLPPRIVIFVHKHTKLQLNKLEYSHAPKRTIVPFSMYHGGAKSKMQCTLDFYAQHASLTTLFRASSSGDRAFGKQ